MTTLRLQILLPAVPCYASQNIATNQPSSTQPIFRNPSMTKRILAIATIATLFTTEVFAADRPAIDVWPGRAPGETKEIGPEESRPPQAKQRADVIRLTNVSKPTL